jgi:hypothetical protein
MKDIGFLLNGYKNFFSAKHEHRERAAYGADAFMHVTAASISKSPLGGVIVVQ